MTNDRASEDSKGLQSLKHAGSLSERSQSSLLVSALVSVLPLAALTCLMAADENFGMSVPFGFVCCMAAAIGILDLFQCFERPPQDTASVVVVRQPLIRQLSRTALAAIALTFALHFGVKGNLPAPELTAAVSIPVAFMLLVVCCYRLVQALGFVDQTQRVTRRYGFWLMLLHSVVYLPLLGSYSLIDPWETHYGEVAREMLARDDWISLWWAQDGWFWSKPVLDFWLQGFSFSLLGVEYLPDQMLSGVAEGARPHPEWAARMPVYLMATLANYLLYKAVSRTVHPRAGFLAALVLSTTPYWALLAHQSMTDMPYVAPMVAGLSLFILGMNMDEQHALRSYELSAAGRRFHFTISHLFIVGVLMCALPQVCYLLSRNLTLDVASGALTLHSDEFMAGSGGHNCGLPGNSACRKLGPKSATWQPALLAMLWLFLSLLFVRLYSHLQSVRGLCFLAAWFSVALSFMAKGAPGVVLPLFVIVVFLAASRRWSVLLQLKPAGLVLAFALLALPWYMQMLARHGFAFVERLLLHDMYKRAFSHVHDTNDGVDVSFRYYIWQLGYGLFPWSGVATAGFLRWANVRGMAPGTKRFSQTDLAMFAGLWFIAAFGLFTISGTKFHHYILPAVPPLAILAGLWLHELVGGWQVRRRSLYAAGLGAATCALLSGAVLWHESPISGVVSSELAQGQALPVAGAAIILLGVAMLIATIYLTANSVANFNSNDTPQASPGLLGLVAAAGTWLVGKDFLTTFAEQLPGQVLLMQLFTYQYKRTWPQHLDVQGPFLAVMLLAIALCAALTHPKVRAHASYLLMATAIVFSAWMLNLYLPLAAPHWGQRETIAAYYRARDSATVPLIAFQMNWKGENFYTGNRIAAFVRSGKPFQEWIAALRERNQRTLYFTTEPSRMGTLKRELGEYRKFEILTTPRQNVRFAIARVEL